MTNQEILALFRNTDPNNDRLIKRMRYFLTKEEFDQFDFLKKTDAFTSDNWWYYHEAEPNGFAILVEPEEERVMLTFCSFIPGLNTQGPREIVNFIPFFSDMCEKLGHKKPYFFDTPHSNHCWYMANSDIELMTALAELGIKDTLRASDGFPLFFMVDIYEGREPVFVAMKPELVATMLDEYQQYKKQNIPDDMIWLHESSGYLNPNE